MRLKFFDATGHFDRPPVVTEVTANLAHHGRHGERQKVCAVVDVEAVDGVEQADARSLHEIVKWFAPATVSTRNVLGERKSALDDGLALTPECRRPLVQHIKVTKHLRHFCIL